MSAPSCHPKRSEGSASSSARNMSGTAKESQARCKVNYNNKLGGSAGVTGAFGGLADFDAGAGFVGEAGAAGLLDEPALPTVRYLRIFSRRLGPMPLIASKSSTLLNAPYALRICKIFSAVTGPIPGTCCNSSDVAVFKFTGAAGGFLLAHKPVPVRQRTENKSSGEARNRPNITVR